MTIIRHDAGVRVLIDEAHQQAWTTRPHLAAQMQPVHPADSSYARAADLLRRHDFSVAVNQHARFDNDILSSVDVLILPHQSLRRYESTTGVGDPRLTDDERKAIHQFVHGGGGLILLAESEQDKYGNNFAELVAPFGISIQHTTVQDYTSYHQAPSWVLGYAAQPRAPHPLLLGVGSVVFYRAGALDATDGAQVVLRASATASPALSGLLATAEFGKGRVAVFSDSDLFGDDCINEFDHAQLWLNTAYYVAGPAFTNQRRLTPSFETTDPHWLALKKAISRLRGLQSADGSIEGSPADRQSAATLVDEVVAAVERLLPRFAHQDDYLTQALIDLRSWQQQGFDKPNFAASLDKFHPERMRRDGIEHLVLFPMYTPNGSLDVRFEALIVRVPWPEWIDVLEQDLFDNPKFVPVHLVDNTEGYDSECAVLFPETVSAAGEAANHFGAIFCDREAARYQRTCQAAIDSTGLLVPTEVAALLASKPMLQDMFELWDLIHDRAHSHGELPFDPFMIRQRLPFWMYSLEELRCDLTAVHQAREVAGDFPFARYVQYGVLFDRLFRFPITGSRVRNYDGLAGQLLFGYLHDAQVLTWRDNSLAIDWERLPEAMEGLRLEIEQVYRGGILSTKVQYWVAAHDLVARYVRPNLASVWTPTRRADRDESDHKQWLALVHPDEFPLSMFYTSLQQRLDTVVAGKAAA